MALTSYSCMACYIIWLEMVKGNYSMIGSYTSGRVLLREEGCHGCSWDSVSKTHILLQLMWWSCSHTCCAKAESILSTALQCSDIKCSPTQLASQSWQLILYTILDLSPSGMRSFGWDRILLGVLKGFMWTWTSIFDRILVTASEIPWMYRMVTRNLGSSFSLSFLMSAEKGGSTLGSHSDRGSPSHMTSPLTLSCL